MQTAQGARAGPGRASGSAGIKKRLRAGRGRRAYQKVSAPAGQALAQASQLQQASGLETTTLPSPSLRTPLGQTLTQEKQPTQLSLFTMGAMVN